MSLTIPSRNGQGDKTYQQRMSPLRCASLLNCPDTAFEQSTTAPPDAVGFSFAADVIKGNRQLILVVRDRIRQIFQNNDIA